VKHLREGLSQGGLSEVGYLMEVCLKGGRLYEFDMFDGAYLHEEYQGECDV
jgi:hypothetical protein